MNRHTTLIPQPFNPYMTMTTMQRLTRSAQMLATMLILSSMLIACSDNPVEADDPSITGRWSGQTTIQGTPLSMDVQLMENNGSISGAGTMVLVDPLAITVTGVYNFPSMTMTVRSNDFDDMSFSGDLGADGNTINGSMRGSGFDNFGFSLRRQ